MAQEKHLILLLLLTIFSCKNQNKNIENNSTTLNNSNNKYFQIHCGINISHWLSQNPDNIPDRKSFFTEKDVEFLSKNGFDHIRLPIDEECLWDIKGAKQPDEFKLLHNAIEWCLKYELKIIVDLHIVRAHYFNNKSNLLWESKVEQDHFVQLWLQLSGELGKYPNTEVAYELLNEAVAPKASDWNSLVAMTIAALRKTEPNRMIVIGSNRQQLPNTFHELVLPENDKNIILSFHFYSPMIFTHYKAPWMEIAAYDGSVNYPGQAVEKDELANYPKDVIAAVNKYNGYFTRDTLLKLILEPIIYTQKHGLQLYCGEFGCLPTVHRSARLKWYKDVRFIFESNNIAWSCWDYKGGFAIFNQQTGSPDNILIKELTEYDALMK
jgi:endoglucanase